MLREFLVVVVILKLAIGCHCKICGSIDIRNDVKDFEKLKNCTIVVGSLQMVLMTNENYFGNISFPQLVEITDYLMIYRVRDLVSLGSLFPNLRVIRGDTLFLDYSFILYNVPNLTEIGLYNLRYIYRGMVNIDKAPQLCFVNTINWAQLGTSLAYKNTNTDFCNACPMKCNGNCWNMEHCQEAVNERCHEECIGCDQPHSAQHCHVCRNFNNDGVCVPQCPNNKYRNNATKVCMTKEECTTVLNGTWKIVKRECLVKCPIEYEPKKLDGESYQTCVYCGNKCPPVICPPKTVINSLGSLQKYHGCNLVNGTLEISSNSVTFEDLQYYLKYIRNITGGLIVRRTTVKSLEFLSNLQRIEAKQYAIFVYENNNLEKLWNFTNSFNLTIVSGSLRFHNNPMLCRKEIEELARKTKVTLTDTDVSRNSNGDRSLICSIVTMKVKIVLDSRSIYISWNDAQPKNDTNIGYTVFFIENSSNSTTMNDSYDDQCRLDGWTSIYTSTRELEIKNLKPYTNYSYYIKVYQAKDINSQTRLSHFFTLADDPDPPRNISTEAVNSSTIEISWLPPENINGELQHYQMVYYMENDYSIIRDERNYCTYGPTKADSYVDKTTADMSLMDISVQPEEKPLECPCAAKPEKETPKTLEIFFVDKFCNSHSTLESKKNSCRPLFYDVDRSNESGSSPALNPNRIYVDKRASVKKSQYSRPPPEVQQKIDSFVQEEIAPTSTSYQITNLRHFTLYSIYLAACNKNNQNPRRPKCGPVLYYYQRTAKKEDADDVIVTVEVKDPQVTISWAEPKDPNGVVTAYYVEYWSNRNKHETDCISRKEHADNGFQYILPKLEPASYTLRVRALSLAGKGRPSEKYYFTIAKPSDMTLEISLLVIILTTCITLGGFYIWYKKRHNVNNIQLITSVNPDYAGIVYVEDEWEIDRSDIEIYDDLGKGTFGQVYSGLIKSKNLCCAIKTVNENVPVNGMRDFLNEALVMKSVNGCHHVVKLLGVVSRDIPPMVVMELMSRGDLKSYLRRSRDSSQTITSNELYRMAAQIADGMVYLSAKKFVHRDLAARNCMVAEDRTVKVGDFGMTRDIYVNDYYRKETKGLLPVRWMAPESLHDGIFTSQSDIWSYGIVLWEMATLAEQPYQGMSNEEVLQYVIGRGRLERPQECPDLLYEIMRACWQYRPRERPQFSDVVVKLVDHVGPDFKLLSYYFNRDGHDIHNVPKSEPTMYSHFDVNNDRVDFYHW